MSDDLQIDYADFCRDMYIRTWEQEYLVDSINNTSASARQTARLMAQRKAIDKVLVEALLRYSSSVSEREI